MGRDLAAASAAAREVFEQADQILGLPISRLCFEGPEEELNRTDIAQPAIYVTSVASYAAGLEAGVIPECADVYAGLSLGEYTALHLAGSFDFETGLRLVRERGIAMQQAATERPSGMVALMGAEEADVLKLCAEAARGAVLAPANFNAPGQIVVSGEKAACERIVPLAEAAGFKAMPLVVAGAFHSELMRRGAERMAAVLAEVRIRQPRSLVYSNVTARPHEDPASIRAALVDQIVKPVRWEETMRSIADPLHVEFVELAPGRVLTGLVKKVNRRMPVRSLATVEGLKETSG
jgi:[acyl-carrier-protein] S-malonyltransferase